MTTASKPKKVEDVVEIPIGQIDPWKEQPRKFFDEDSIEQLAESLKLEEQTEPAIVTPINGNSTSRYLLISGERRYRASKLAGLKTMKCIVRTYAHRDDMIFEASLANIGRESLTDLDEAGQFKLMLSTERVKGMKRGERIPYVASVCGKSPKYVSDRLALLKLDPEVQAYLLPTETSKRPQMPLVVAVDLARNVNDPDEQRRTAKKIINSGGSRMPAWRAKKLIEEKSDRTTKRPGRKKPSDWEKMFTDKLRVMMSSAENIIGSEADLVRGLSRLSKAQRTALVERVDAAMEQLGKLRAIVKSADRVARARTTGANAAAN